MDQFVTPLTLENLLHHCTDRSSPHWEKGWREFLRLYKPAIYRNVTGYCYSWRLPRLKLQLSEVINDIVTEVLYYLCRNDFKALRNYHQFDNEKRFRAWLALVCNSCSTRYLQSHFTDSLSEDNLDDLRSTIVGLDSDIREDLYDNLIASLRSSAGSKKRNLERDIHFFMLNLWSKFTPTQIPSLPTIPPVSAGAVYRIIERLRDSLKKNKKYFF